MLHIDRNIENLASKYSTLMLAWGQKVCTFFLKKIMLHIKLQGHLQVK